MALGDKLPVVMGKEKAVANGVATLDSDGKLAKSQRPTPTEAGSADLTLSNLSNYQTALRNIGGRPNRNLLDNAYFKGGGSQQGGGQFPINQRGQTSYTNAKTSMYTIDRWILGWDKTMTITESGLVFDSTADLLQQTNPVNAAQIIGKLITITVLDSENHLYTVSAVYNGTDTITDPDVKVSFAPYYGGKPHSFWIRANNVIAAKLELGPTQTLAYQDEDGNWQLFETPDYGEELAKCRYYFRRYGVSSLGQIYLPPALGVSGTEANFSIVSEPMRIAPTISGNGFLLAGTTGDGFIADGSASFSLLGASPLSGIITVKVTCSNRTLIPGNYYTLYANPEYGAFLDLSAEL